MPEMQRLTAETFAALKKAAEQGDGHAQYLAGIAYLNGNGVVKNIAEGERWMLLAAERNHAAAQCDLGALYIDGRVLKQNYFDGVKWLNRAAEQGDALAMSGLGSVNAKGFRERSVGFFERMRYASMSIDRVEAYKWFSLARRAGHAAAEKDLWLLRRLMSAEQITTAERKIAEYEQSRKRAAQAEARRQLTVHYEGGEEQEIALAPDDVEAWAYRTQIGGRLIEAICDDEGYVIWPEKDGSRIL